MNREEKIEYIATNINLPREQISELVNDPEFNADLLVRASYYRLVDYAGKEYQMIQDARAASRYEYGGEGCLDWFTIVEATRRGVDMSRWDNPPLDIKTGCRIWDVKRIPWSREPWCLIGERRAIDLAERGIGPNYVNSAYMKNAHWLNTKADFADQIVELYEGGVTVDHFKSMVDARILPEWSNPERKWFFDTRNRPDGWMDEYRRYWISLVQIGATPGEIRYWNHVGLTCGALEKLKTERALQPKVKEWLTSLSKQDRRTLYLMALDARAEASNGAYRYDHFPLLVQETANAVINWEYGRVSPTGFIEMYDKACDFQDNPPEYIELFERFRKEVITRNREIDWKNDVI